MLPGRVRTFGTAVVARVNTQRLHEQAMSESGVSFAHDEETRMIVDNLEQFVEQEVKPIQQELGETYENPRLRHETDGRLVPEVVEATQEIRRRSAEAGYYAMNLPE